jgi:hypothetical protein
VVIVGPRTVFPGVRCVRSKQITDGESNSIAVVESCGLRIPWYEPRDLKADEMSFRINDPSISVSPAATPAGRKSASPTEASGS